MNERRDDALLLEVRYDVTVDDYTHVFWQIVHAIVAIMFEVCNILIELKTESIVQGQPVKYCERRRCSLIFTCQFDKKMELTSQICTVCSDKSIMRRFEVIFYAMRQVDFARYLVKNSISLTDALE